MSIRPVKKITPLLMRISTQIEGQQTERPAASVSKDEDAAGEGALSELPPTDLGQALDHLAAVDRLNGDQDSHLRGELS